MAPSLALHSAFFFFFLCESDKALSFAGIHAIFLSPFSFFFFLCGE